MSDLPSREAVAIDLALTERVRGRTLTPLYDIIEIGRAYVSGRLVDREVTIDKQKAYEIYAEHQWGGQHHDDYAEDCHICRGAVGRMFDAALREV